MRWPLLIAAAAPALLSFAAAAQDSAGVTVEDVPPRTVGYFLGDRLHYAGRIEVPEGFAIDEAARPRPRELDYWLDLDAVTIASARAGGRQRFDVALRYQTFYVPLEPREMRIPPVPLGFVRAADGARLEAVLPGFVFVNSPLRPILQRSSPDTMRPDAPLVVIDTRIAQWRTGAAFGASLALLGALAAYRGWLPIGRRVRRPLGEASRRIARSAPEAGKEAYGAALLALHRALDATARERFFADDLDRLLAAHPRFAEARSELARFLAASRAYFFSGDGVAAAAILPPRDLAAIARRLAAIERAP